MKLDTFRWSLERFEKSVSRFEQVATHTPVVWQELYCAGKRVNDLGKGMRLRYAALGICPRDLSHKTIASLQRFSAAVQQVLLRCERGPQDLVEALWNYDRNMYIRADVISQYAEDGEALQSFLDELQPPDMPDW